MELKKDMSSQWAIELPLCQRQTTTISKLKEEKIDIGEYNN